MTARFAVSALALVASVALLGCEREQVPEVVSNAAQQTSETAKDLAKQAERGMERAGAVLDDATVTAKVKMELIAAPELSGVSIDVDTKENVVTLNGTVRSDTARERAGEIARNTEGVKEVRNNLAVQPTS